jgi:hypothetical protein
MERLAIVAHEPEKTPQVIDEIIEDLRQQGDGDD